MAVSPGPIDYAQYAHDTMGQKGQIPDPAQSEAITTISTWTTSWCVHHQASRIAPPPSRWARFRARWIRRPSDGGSQGCYVWGPVGRGKSYLVDVWVQYMALYHPTIAIRRFHFHDFMRMVHQAMHRLRDVPDPLQAWLQEVGSDTDGWCFDEFYVTDIADAMLLGRIFQGSVAMGHRWVITSNQPPEGLYPHGLQRALFLPTIALLRDRLEVIHVNGNQDYRAQYMQDHPCFHRLVTGTLAESDPILARHFSQWTDPGTAVFAATVLIQGRPVVVRAHDPVRKVLWCDVDKLCGQAKSYEDYAEIAQRYALLIMGPVPIWGMAHDDQVRRFIHLIDELYDKGVKLCATSVGTWEQVYGGTALRDTWQRTVSRLQEMQTSHYWGKPHGRSGHAA